MKAKPKNSVFWRAGTALLTKRSPSELIDFERAGNTAYVCGIGPLSGLEIYLLKLSVKRQRPEFGSNAFVLGPDGLVGGFWRRLPAL